MKEPTKITLTIDGRDIEIVAGTSVLEAALDAGTYIPHLCYHPDLSPIGACRLCIVEIEGNAEPVPSCATPAAAGMIVRTRSDVIDHRRRLAMELLLAGHPQECDTCNKYLNCELQSLKQYLIGKELSVRTRSRVLPINTSNPLFLHDPNKCVVCGRCVRACREMRGVGVLQYRKKAPETYCGPTADMLGEAGCRFCGACAEVCPTGAIADRAELVKGKKRKPALVPCRYTCPAEIDVPRYLRFIRRQDYAAAAAVIWEKVPFPQVLGYVCDRPCEGVCRRGELNQPISIRELKRFAVEHDDIPATLPEPRPPTGQKVAIVGSGPAGLTAAWCLANQGHQVTVFESLPMAGGMMRTGIPEFHLPRTVLDGEISEIERRGVEIRTNTRVEAVDNLFAQGYHAIVVAIGTHRGQRLPVPGADGDGVTDCIDFLRSVHLGKPVSVGQKVMVLGGGGVAFDVARVARRMGAAEVRVACLESRKDIPASAEDVADSERESILLYPGRTATRILRTKGAVLGVEFLEVTSFGFDDDGNVQIETREDSPHFLPADQVIFAIGQRPDIPASFGLAVTSRHLFEVDPVSFQTSREGVFAAGDAATGTASVIKAIASGRKAAIAVDRFLGGNGYIDRELAPDAAPSTCLGLKEGFAAMARSTGALDENTAEYEANRCLQCDLRLDIKPVKFWGSY